MSAQGIAAEISAALEDVAKEVGSGAFTVTFVRSPVDEPTTPWGAPALGDPVEFTLPAMFDKWNKNEVDGTLIRATDKKIIVSAIGEVPTVADSMMISGVKHEIMEVIPEAPSGIALYYTIHARK